MVEKIRKAWLFTVYHPDDHEKEINERRILLQKKYKALRFAHEELEPLLKEHNRVLSFETLKRIAYGNYFTKNGSLNRIVTCEKSTIKITVEPSKNKKSVEDLKESDEVPQNL